MNRRVAGLLAGALLLLTGCGAAAPTSPSAVPVSCAGDSVAGLTAEQSSNARSIAAVALGLGLGRQGVLVGVVAAYTEATLRSLDYGDYSSSGQMTTSRGLFQMKDSWGSLADRLDATKAAAIFYTIDKGSGVRGLTHIPNWQSMTAPQAAQAVEGSAFSDGGNYQRNLAVATAITDAIVTGCAATPISSGGAGLAQNPSQDPSSFGWVRAAGQVPFTWQGHNMGQVASGTQGLWTAMLNELVPLIPGGLNGSVGCFSDRQNRNNPSMASFHSYGLACDLNSDVNSNGTSPQGLQGRQYALPMAASQVAARFGMRWGGDFTGVPDPMHLELALSPQQVAQWNQQNGIQ